MRYETKDCKTQIKFRPTILDNEKYWQVFNREKQIEDFLQFINEFEPHFSDSNYNTDYSEENFLGEEEPSPELANINLLSSKLEKKIEMNAEFEIGDLETLQSNDESFPKGLGPLEELFDFNDVAKKPKMEPVETEVEE